MFGYKASGKFFFQTIFLLNIGKLILFINQETRASNFLMIKLKPNVLIIIIISSSSSSNRSRRGIKRSCISSSIGIILILESFSHQRQLMIFHWSLSGSKSPQVSVTLLSILTDLNNAVVLIIFIRRVISKPIPPCTNPLVTLPRARIKIGITVIFMFHSFCNSLVSSRYLSFFSLSFNFTLWSTGTAKSTILQIFVVVDYYKIWSSGWDQVICLFLKISEKFVRLILEDRFWLEHMPFVRMIKFKFLLQFPVDYLAHLVVSSLILLLR